jgi:thiol-disulfide isomerase/thioredoxin
LRPVILLLLAAAMIGGCDRQSQAPQQASESNVGNSLTAPVNEVVVVEEIGTLERGQKGAAAPGIKFKAPDGSEVTLASFQGKPLLLNLWATWCVPCVKEMPTLDALAEQLDGRVQVLVLSQDLEGKAKVDPFFAKSNFKRLQPYLDTNAAFSLGMGINLPTTILYDSSGKEVWRMLGGMDWTGETAKELIAEAV